MSSATSIEIWKPTSLLLKVYQGKWLDYGTVSAIFDRRPFAIHLYFRKKPKCQDNEKANFINDILSQTAWVPIYQMKGI